MLVLSISMLFLFSHLILAPRPCKIWQESLTSMILGTLLIIHVPLISKVAGKIATAEFLAPLIVTSPF